MAKPRLIGIGSLLLGTGIATSALLGPQALGVIGPRVSDTMENQLAGGELVSLCLAAPAAIVAGLLWLRGHRLAPLLGIGPSLYAVYTYPQFVVGPQYDRYPGNVELFFPLYLVLVILGWATALGAWAALREGPLPPLPPRLRAVLAVALLAMSLFFALAWTGSIADVLHGGSPPEEYATDPTLFWLIRLMDLGFVIPLGLVTVAGLIRRTPWATRLAYAYTAVLALLGSAVAGMAVVMTVKRDPAVSAAMLAVTVPAALALLSLYGLMLRSASRGGPSDPAPRGSAGARDALRP